MTSFHSRQNRLTDTDGRFAVPSAVDAHCAPASNQRVAVLAAVLDQLASQNHPGTTLADPHLATSSWTRREWQCSRLFSFDTQFVLYDHHC